MPIVDGLTSTKMIRSHETTSSSHSLSKRAAINSRIPIIAVSASLIEKERQTYMDAGFDAWILKPISFPRLNELMKGIVDTTIRESALYQPGKWEQGGWFAMPTSDSPADTKLESGKTVPSAAPKGLKEAAADGADHVASTDFATGKQNDDIFSDVDPNAKQSKNKSMPQLRLPGDLDSSVDGEQEAGPGTTSIFPGQEVASPDPMT
jgi:CheY-like chemotaxis protein